MRIANTQEQLREHLAATGSKVVTRFPPEPNGYLHIGHAKAMFVDFGMAAQYDGVCYLRFDDTNPEAEKQEYIDHIQDIVAWMGWTPWKITHAADYFQQLYELAVELIRRGHAYVCHQTSDEIRDYREKRMPSPWRDRPVEESLRLFEEMKNGLIDEGKATLRMRQDVKNENYNMFDLIAYRIKFTPHPHAGDKWCIYPSYDYTHWCAERRPETSSCPALGSDIPFPLAQHQRLPREHHPLDVHPRVRAPPGVLLLAARGAGSLQALRLGVLADEHHQHGPVQAQAAKAGQGQVRPLMG